jgi:hypothetical protein
MYFAQLLCLLIISGLGLLVSGQFPIKFVFSLYFGYTVEPVRSDI